MLLYQKYRNVQDDVELAKLSITIANLKLKELSRRSRRYSESLEGEDGRQVQVADEGLTPEEALLQMEGSADKLKRLRSAIASLDKSCRDLIRMQLENWTSAAMADALQVSIDTLYVRANRCREKVRKLVSANGGLR